MLISDRGAVALIGHEGIVPGPYLDGAKVWTWGVGHTAAAGPPDPVLMARGMPGDLDAVVARALDLFRVDVAHYAAEVTAALDVIVSQTEFDALVSFHYNTGAISRAGLTAALNRGDRAGAALGFMGWKKPFSVIERRQAEQLLFAKGIYPATVITVWQVGPDGRVIWHPAQTLSAGQALAIMQRGQGAAPAGPAAAPAPLPAPAPIPAAPAPAAPPVGPVARPAPAAPAPSAWWAALWAAFLRWISGN